jgi:hypothetical protein
MIVKTPRKSASAYAPITASTLLRLNVLIRIPQLDTTRAMRNRNA